MEAKSVAKNYLFLTILVAAMVAGAFFGWVNPEGGHSIAFLGTIFIRMMFCVVVPMVFASVAGAIANIKSRARAGKIMFMTILNFVITAAIAGAIYFVLVMIFPPVLTAWTETASEAVGEHASFTQLIVNFFTVDDFAGLLSRRAMLPLIVFSILFGFSVNFCGEKASLIMKWLDQMTLVMMKFVGIVTYYAPIAFFAIFADLVASYGPMITEGYARALIVYYPFCFIYVFTMFPLMAWIGAGSDGVREMFRHITRPAVVSLGTCSSVATIPTNMDVAAETGISKDISDIVLPLGATMHMDGSSAAIILKVAFVMGVLGQPLTFSQMPLIILVAILASVGMSGVPGGGYIGEYILCAVFFPNQMELAFPIVVAIGNLVDPPATMINAAGDYVVSFMIARCVDGKDWLKKARIAKAAQA